MSVFAVASATGAVAGALCWVLNANAGAGTDSTTGGATVVMMNAMAMVFFVEAIV